MIISSRLERRLSITATALLTAAAFAMPIKTRTFTESRPSANYVNVAEAGTSDRTYRDHGRARPR
ncbi:hypothetical protein [Phyllobacterium sp. UNC302MFCol5.2]|uniref:hypothetical protein n=1 Tax=Phyllobacterium sp. UNC302MFCol5.2 TaxID=1449065 RepID=UPI000487CBC9|nr:hypothetical protein [Phyllobacterium sp. UNC302MFCol5.2]